MPVASSATRQSLGGPSKSNSRAYPEASSAFPVPQKLNFHVLGELVDRHNPKAQAGGLERRLVAYANWDHCNFAPHRGIAGEYFMLWRSQPDTRQLHGARVSFHLIPHLRAQPNTLLLRFDDLEDNLAVGARGDCFQNGAD